MSVLSAGETPTRSSRSLRDVVRDVPWTSVIVVGVLLAYVDGFVMVSLRGAIGYIGRVQKPFDTWLLHSTLYAPLFVLAAWGGFALARRWATGRRRLLTTTALVTLTTTLTAVAITAVNSAYDYQLQAKEMVATMAAMRMTGMQGALADGAAVQVKGVSLAAAVLLVINLVMVLWIAGMRGGRLSR